MRNLQHKPLQKESVDIVSEKIYTAHGDKVSES